MTVVVEEPPASRDAVSAPSRARGFLRSVVEQMSKFRNVLRSVAEFAYELLTGPF
jgi:hypothetical protein